MQAQTTVIPDVLILQPRIYEDERGFFMETYQLERYAKNGIYSTFVQDNHAGSRHGVLRGLHYQIHRPQGKLLRVVVGEVFDVAVDLRRCSSTFGKWVGVRISAQNRLQMWIPPGFAHGYYVLSDWAELVYKATDYYAPQWDRTLLWNDPDVGIEWPIMPPDPPVISEKDKQGKLLGEAEVYT